MANKVRVLSDREIGKFEEDLIGFKPIARAMERIITDVEPPFTIGVVGSWGVGKTSLMRMTQDLLEKKMPIVWFDAWAFDRTEDLRVALIRRILHEFGKVPGIMNKLKSYKKRFGDKMDWTNLANWLLSLIPGQPLKMKDQTPPAQDFLEEFEGLVRKFLEATRKDRLVIFIDDLDRCTPPKPLEVLEAIKLLLWVEGCVFVLGLQKETIEKSVALKYQEEGKVAIFGTEYLDKIFQLEYHLRELRESDVLGFINRLKDDEMISGAISNYSDVISRVGGNLRRVKRLLNKFEMFRALKEENPRLRDVLDDRVLGKLLVLEYHPRWNRLYNLVMNPMYVTKGKKSRILQTLKKAFLEYRELGTEDVTTEGTFEDLEAKALREFLRDANLMDFLNEQPELWDVMIESYIYLVGRRVEPIPEGLLEILRTGGLFEIMLAGEEISAKDMTISADLVEGILAVTYQSDSSARYNALYVLARLKDSIPEDQLSVVVGRLMELSEDSSSNVRGGAANALGTFKDNIQKEQLSGVVERLMKLSSDQNGIVRSSVADTFGRLQANIPKEQLSGVVEKLSVLSEDPDSSVSKTASEVLARFSGKITQ